MLQTTEPAVNFQTACEDKIVLSGMMVDVDLLVTSGSSLQAVDMTSLTRHAGSNLQKHQRKFPYRHYLHKLTKFEIKWLISCLKKH